jgi:hypothetical protein
MTSLRFRDFAIVAFILFVFFLSRTEIADAQTASGPTIFDVRRSLPLEPDEEVTKDFYINAGPEAGFKKGVYISVVRAVPVHDPIKNMQQATLNIPVGKLKVIDVQRGITVARLETELTDDERPTLEFEGVMVGDRIDLGSITTEQPKKPKPKAKKQIADASTNAAPEPAPGSAEAMAVRSAGLVPTTAQAAAPASVSATMPVDTSKPVEMTTTADVKTESVPAAATNNSAAPRAPVETAPKKSQAPKSADLEEGFSERNSYPRSFAADSVRVADYTDAGF